jgi:PadR family transcriptional regulator PadR
MREASYYAMTALLEGPAHGYAVLERIRRLTGGQVSLTTGTLYGTLDRLVDEGMIQRAGAEIVNGRARQYFEITETGSGALQVESERLAQAAAAFDEAMRAKRAKTRPLRLPTPGTTAVIGHAFLFRSRGPATLATPALLVS